MGSGQRPSKEAPLALGATSGVNYPSSHHRLFGISVPSLQMPVVSPSSYGNPKCLYIIPNLPRGVVLVPVENHEAKIVFQVGG